MNNYGYRENPLLRLSSFVDYSLHFHRMLLHSWWVSAHLRFEDIHRTTSLLLHAIRAPRIEENLNMSPHDYGKNS